MNLKKRLRDYGLKVGKMSTGPKNTITDVKGVMVGHTTLSNNSVQTGVTAIIPHTGNIFLEKYIGATHVINGFGKTIGTIQIDELGTIETPILLTNTLSIGTCADSLLKYMIDSNKEIGRITGTVNPIVCECNDMFLNDIRSFSVTNEHVLDALQNASETFEEGSVGAGTGMRCFGLKGGIGSSSRTFEIHSNTYTLGVLVLTNYGKLSDFTFLGTPLGERLMPLIPSKVESDKGSIIMVVATDLPVSDRQLKRILKRTSVGLSKTGSFIGNGSGDIAIGFSTANTIPHFSKSGLQALSQLHEDEIDQSFIAVAEATEEAILNSLLSANTTIGRDGNTLYSLRDYIDQLI
ncbi:P1 family peptidase [Bacillus luteolus]|uniref:P1 family peptidase n=1 Tax=Litchfieldia luteola TaxID=682179 RepID=A0ABR9QNM8_9BACI|nr:P1 family peptidase [Cytobacillus luteolus]MBE4910101.1 P1 family peptidase [Cytobacillus luteolus]MBP1942335.1 D-aminopeptidase [Cytobacillus luteolus]